MAFEPEFQHEGMAVHFSMGPQYNFYAFYSDTEMCAKFSSSFDGESLITPSFGFSNNERTVGDTLKYNTWDLCEFVTKETGLALDMNNLAKIFGAICDSVEYPFRQTKQIAQLNVFFNNAGRPITIFSSPAFDSYQKLRARGSDLTLSRLTMK